MDGDILKLLAGLCRALSRHLQDIDYAADHAVIDILLQIDALRKRRGETEDQA
jgi:hypothetical protein